MKYTLNKHSAILDSEILLSASKSESNRALLINALSGNKIALHNLSNARDTQTMTQLLSENPEEWNVLDAGTTMRFLTAYLAINGEHKVITGSPRMKERPIGPLVDALRKLGAEIDYLENDGYPPLKINRINNQLTDAISIPGNISSQYISALLMIAPYLTNGLKITLTSEVFSKPYILMTLDLMKSFGAKYDWSDNVITVETGTYNDGEYTIEGDWSGASYWYSFIALSTNVDSTVRIPHLRDQSSQGDRRIAEIMSSLGVKTVFDKTHITLTKIAIPKKELLLDLKDCPDLAQTIMVIAAVKGIAITFTGLESLKIKETDRVAAMMNELEKIGAKLEENENEWYLKPSSHLPDQVQIHTYEDHRMAMAFAPLCQIMNVVIEDPDVVNKSFPGYWEQMKKVGMTVSSS